MKNIAYDTDKDFILLSIMPAGSLPMVAAGKTGAKNLKEFVEYARKDHKVSVGTYAAGSWAHIAIAELNKQYGLRMEPVHYRGEAPMWADLASKSLDGAIGSYGAALPLLQSGRGMPSLFRGGDRPCFPTADVHGTRRHVAGVPLTGFQCCVAPAGTPPEIVRKLSQLLVEAGKGEKVQDMKRALRHRRSRHDLRGVAKALHRGNSDLA